jgi:hypothetical protein
VIGLERTDYANLGPISRSARNTAARLNADIAKVPIGCPIVIDGLAFGVLPEACSFRKRTPLIALVHQPLALESALNAKQSEALREIIASAAARCDGLGDGETISYIQYVDLAAQVSKLLDDSSIVSISACRRLEIARDDERQPSRKATRVGLSVVCQAHPTNLCENAGA